MSTLDADYLVRLGERRRLGAYVTHHDGGAEEVSISYRQDLAQRYSRAEAELLAAELGDARVVRLRRRTTNGAR